MLSNMPKSVFNGLAALTVAIPVVAWSTLPRVHNVQSQSVNGVEEHVGSQFTYHTATGGNATFSWQEGTLHGFGNLQVKTQTDTFEFKLVRLSSASADEVYGEWDVNKNGGALCAGCKGYLYVSTADLGYDYFKGYVHTNDSSAYYLFGGNLTNRFEY
ncbi:hypothetical protein ACN28E_00680 [Archangium lansingense]|uniref:hypothetical protein n=1 Tax=Archangium lansingense TaxID=2995310 RepID=UPI003B80EC70